LWRNQQVSLEKIYTAMLIRVVLEAVAMFSFMEVSKWEQQEEEVSPI
jgi:hypothetical protein